MENQNKKNGSKRDLHKRLSQMEIEINELNDLLTENIDSSQRKRLATNDFSNNFDDLNVFENAILNDKINFSEKSNCAEKEEVSNNDIEKEKLGDTPNSKAKNEWAVYTNQEGRRIHEITVKQKILEIEKNPNDKLHVSKPIENETNSANDKILVELPTLLPAKDAEKREGFQKPSVLNNNFAIINQNNKTTDKLVEPVKDSIYRNQPKKNPFRVVSVTIGESKNDKQNISDIHLQESAEKASFMAKSPSPEPSSEIAKVEEIRKTFEEIQLPSDMEIMLKLHDHLCNKIKKLINEIEYVEKIVNNHYSYSLSFDELNQFKNGNRILKNYLDKKYKQKYELELRLSSKFRKLKNEDKMNPSLFFANR